MSATVSITKGMKLAKHMQISKHANQDLTIRNNTYVEVIYSNKESLAKSFFSILEVQSNKIINS